MCALGIRHAVLGSAESEAELGAVDAGEAVGGACLGEERCSGEVVVIGECQRTQAEPTPLHDQIGGTAGAVEEAEVAVAVQLGVRRDRLGPDDLHRLCRRSLASGHRCVLDARAPGRTAGVRSPATGPAGCSSPWTKRSRTSVRLQGGRPPATSDPTIGIPWPEARYRQLMKQRRPRLSAVRRSCGRHSCAARRLGSQRRRAGDDQVGGCLPVSSTEPPSISNACVPPRSTVWGCSALPFVCCNPEGRQA